MSQAHLSEGSVEPPKNDGKLRLYSMEFCPYAQRARLILKAKNVPHDIVNVNLIKKPDWYFKIHPEGKVPALDIGSKVIVESVDVANYLNDTYPDPPLYPAEPQACQEDKELIDKIGPLTGVFYNIVLKLQDKTPEEWLKMLYPHLELFEEELKKRGTTFFFGDKPGMVDYMIWPWAERSGAIKIALKENLPLKPDDFPLLRKWKKEMRKDPVCDSIYHGSEKFYKIAQRKLNNDPTYDDLL